MRKRFEQQIQIGCIAISDVTFPLNSRDELPAILAGLQYLFVTPELNEQVFKLLEEKICSTKKKTGRNGMDLWHILVLAVVRHGVSTNWDTLETIANYNSLVRDILGVNSPLLDRNEDTKISFTRQTILDNVSLIDAELLQQINKLVVSAGHGLFKKKGDAELELKTDSYVLETNIHFPTDLNLLWDSLRKCIDTIKQIAIADGVPYLPGWRKVNKLCSSLKALFRQTSQQVFKGRNEKKKTEMVKQYLDAALKLSFRCAEVIKNRDTAKGDTDSQVIALKKYNAYVTKFCDQIDRRLLKGETIPAGEKIFSIFEPDTEWITKGKLGKNVELGHLLLITTDNNQLIVDYKIMEKEKDHAQVKPLIKRLEEQYPNVKIKSHSFDKGFSSKENKEALLAAKVEHVVLPKKGKLNQKEKEEESQLLFVRLRHAHSAVESNINMLEHHGLSRCMDKGTKHYKRNVGLSVLAYNLHIIGNKIKADEIKRQLLLRKQRERYHKNAA